MIIPLRSTFHRKNSGKSITKKEVLLRRFGTENYHDEVVVRFSLFFNISKNSTISLTFFGAVYFLLIIYSTHCRMTLGRASCYIETCLNLNLLLFLSKTTNVIFFQILVIGTACCRNDIYCREQKKLVVKIIRHMTGPDVNLTKKYLGVPRV
jgi:hypothetical protein